MGSQLTIPQTIQVGHVSAALSTIYTSKRALFGGSVIRPIPPLQIQIISDVLEWSYDGGAETDQNNRLLAGYLYWLCGLFQLQAQNIISGPGGGSVVPTPSGGGSVNVLDFIVSAITIIATGESSIYFDGTNGNPDFRGLDVNFARNGTTQYTTNPSTGELYYGWNKVTGFFQLLGTSAEAAEGERFRIMPDTASVSSGSATDVAPSVTVLPSQWEPDGITLNLQYIVDAGEVALFVSGYNSNFLVAPTNFTYTAGGLVMVDVGFDAANFPFTLIMKIN